MARMGDFRPFVRYVDGGFVLTYWSARGCDGLWRHRPLTRLEVIAWRLFQRTPKP